MCLPHTSILTNFQTRACFEAKSGRCIFYICLLWDSRPSSAPSRLVGPVSHLTQPSSSCCLCPVLHLISLTPTLSKDISVCMFASQLCAAVQQFMGYLWKAGLEILDRCQL